MCIGVGSERAIPRCRAGDARGAKDRAASCLSAIHTLAFCACAAGQGADCVARFWCATPIGAVFELSAAFGRTCVFASGVATAALFADPSVAALWIRRAFAKRRGTSALVLRRTDLTERVGQLRIGVDAVVGRAALRGVCARRIQRGARTQLRGSAGSLRARSLTQSRGTAAWLARSRRRVAARDAAVRAPSTGSVSCTVCVCVSRRASVARCVLVGRCPAACPEHRRQSPCKARGSEPSIKHLHGQSCANAVPLRTS